MPPDVIEGPDLPLSATDGIPGPRSAVRSIVVPFGISAVPRLSPIKVRRRTTWSPEPEAQRVVERAGSRDWFTDRLFVESKQANLPAACSTSAMVHGVLVVLVMVLLFARGSHDDLTPRKLMDVSLRMPNMASLLPPAVAPPARKSVQRSTPGDSARRPPPPARAIQAPPPPAPLEAPSSVEAEPSPLVDAPTETAPAGGDVGTTDGVPGGVPGGTGSGPSVESAHQRAAGPFRVGEGIDPPRKIKDVKPVYPASAMAARIGGNVLIEATIGADGKVHDTRVVRSIAFLDDAALHAVRQWEFEPARRDGAAVAVTMVIIVTFALL